MAMTLNAPLTPPASLSPVSDASVSPPVQTVTLGSDQVPTLPSTTGSPNANSQMKRKPSRRANTAERRATHNAVERQRRETLNGRFLDLAALLPNLSQIRRPSKSSIVNSSIAHINASRRHRLLAARELRAIKSEADALRRELNEWRDRANLPRVEEPVRGDGFNMVLSGEIEVLATVIEDEDDIGGQAGYDGYDDGEDDYGAVGLHSGMDDGDDARVQAAAAAAMHKNVGANAVSHGGNTYQLLARPAHGPMIVTNPPSVSYENPAMASLYEPAFDASFLQAPISQQDVDKAVWNAPLFGGVSQHQQMLQPRAFLNMPPSPLSSSSSATGSPSSTFADPATQAYMANIHRQTQQMSVAMQQGHLFGSPDRDDTSSVGSGDSSRGRSGSVGTGSGYGTPPLVSPTDGYDMGMNAGDYAARRVSTGSLHVVNNGRAWCDDGMGNSLMTQNMVMPISVGGGGNGAFMMRM